MPQADSTMTVGDLITLLRSCDASLPIGIACSPLETPDDNITLLEPQVEEHSDTRVILFAANLNIALLYRK